MTLRNIVVAAALVAAGTTGAHAATISGQLDVTGNLVSENSTFSSTGNVDFDPQIGFANIATGDFSSINTTFEGSPTVFSLNDINFSAPGLIYSGGGFDFTALSFGNFDNSAPSRGFTATGIFTAAGFDDTPAFLTLSTQGTTSTASFSSTAVPSPVPVPAAGFLLFAALGGLGMLRRFTKTT